MHSILEILEESTDSAGPDLITLDDLKLALGITGNTEDAALQAAITQQSKIIAEYCDRRFGLAQAVETFTFDPFETLPARQALVLKLYPVLEISEVSTAGATAANYHFDPNSGRLWLTDNQWPYGYWRPMTYGYWPASVMVSYSGGYDLPEQAPARLQQAIITSIRTQRFSAARDPAITELQHGEARTRIMYSDAKTAYGSYDFLGPIEDLIQPYRRFYIA